MRPIECLNIPDLRPARDFGPVPELRWLPIAKLFVDDTYQRPITAQGRANIAFIAETFDWRKFSPVVVAPIAGGDYAIVDGQHRTHAARLCGIGEVPCIVVQAASHDQARTFLAINANATRLYMQNLYKARYAAGDKDVLSLVRVGAAEGVDFVWYNCAANKMEKNQTCAFNTLAKVLRRDGEAQLGLTLFAILAARAEHGSNLTAQWIGAFAGVFAAHETWRDRDWLKASLRTFSPVDAAAKIQQARGGAVRGEAIAKAAIVAHLSRGTAISARQGGL